MVNLKNVARLRRRRVSVDKAEPFPSRRSAGCRIRTQTQDRVVRVDADLAAEVRARLDLDAGSSRFADGRSS